MLLRLFQRGHAGAAGLEVLLWALTAQSVAPRPSICLIWEPLPRPLHLNETPGDPRYIKGGECSRTAASRPPACPLMGCQACSPHSPPGLCHLSFTEQFRVHPPPLHPPFVSETR